MSLLRKDWLLITEATGALESFQYSQGIDVDKEKKGHVWSETMLEEWKCLFAYT